MRSGVLSYQGGKIYAPTVTRRFELYSRCLIFYLFVAKAGNRLTTPPNPHMKKLTFTLLATVALSSSVFAGREVVDYKDGKTTSYPPEQCFKDTEFQVDIFGSYTDTVSSGRYGDGLGGGIGVNYFFSRYLGLGVDGNVFDGNANGLWQTSGRLIARYPIETGSLCIAPYVFGGAGVQSNGETVGSWHAGGGLEWRATHSFGLFGEGRYTWTADSAEDSGQARLGARFVF